MSQDRAVGGRTGDSSLLRRLNLAAALGAFLEAETLTLRELRAVVGVSRPTAEDLLAELLAEGRVEETTPPRQPSEARGAGRPARYFRFRAESGYVSGLDIGAHKAMAVVTDLRGRTLATHRVELDPELPASDRVRAAVEAAHSSWAQANLGPADITGIACGVTGALRAAEGVHDVREGPFGSGLAPYSLPGFTEIDVAGELSAGLGKPVAVANDVKLAALAEHWKGAAREYRDIVYMFAGHRAGAGVLIDGQVHQGRHGAAGEIGVFPMLGWEAAMARLHAQGAVLADEQGVGPGSEGELVITSAARQDPESLAVLIEFAEALARGAAVLALAVDPEVIVLGGGMSRGGAIIAEPFRRELARLTLVPLEVITSTMGADSVALGAARMALDTVIADLLAVPGS
ncbi:putative NBD/HSP70 family sugar kinase [Kribbella steppae]|uniref:Putative NBD/HSP70 family sugar kinase n=1 Tax=Kribbella steppae TaxID=2512223 RepID=A0A4R2HCN9_9ACTN|nr:ROK family protein [Kribbella steppae]TCO26151.1 putative NBD/HSP70 family sugar kinase [Kribbella steppae]